MTDRLLPPRIPQLIRHLGSQAHPGRVTPMALLSFHNELVLTSLHQALSLATSGVADTPLHGRNQHVALPV